MNDARKKNISSQCVTSFPLNNVPDSRASLDVFFAYR
jgi:hypothetical protein